MVTNNADKGNGNELNKRKQVITDLFLDNVNILVSYLDRDFNILWANETAARAFDVEVDEIIGCKCYEIVSKEQGPCDDCPVLRAIQTATTHENNKITPDGRQWKIMGVPVGGEENIITGAVEIAIDITEKEQLQKKLTEQNMLLEGTLNAISDLVGIQYPDYTVMRYNQAGYEMLGICPEDVKGEKCYELLGKDEVCRECASNKALQTKKLETTEKYFPELGRYVNIRSNPVFNEDGEIAYLVEHLQDITDRKKAEIELRESRNLLQGIFESIQDGISVVTPDLTIIQSNNKIKEWYRDSLPVEGKKCYEAYRGVNEPCDPCPALRCLDSGEVEKIEVKADAEEGVWWKEIISYPLREEGEIRGVVTFTKDITERKIAEEKIATYTRELESRNKEVEELNQRLNEEMKSARQIHEKILPQYLPNINDISIAAYYQPEMYIGGDFYNVIKAENKLVFYLSALSGHGMEGAIVSSFVNQAIGGYIKLKPENISPDKILEHLVYQYKDENYPDDYFISFFLGVLDLNTWELKYTGAGFHIPVMVFKENEFIMELTPRNLPISNSVPINLMDFDYNRVILSRKSTIFMSTDGLIEQTKEDDGEMFGTTGVSEVLKENGHLPPECIKERLNEEFKSFNNGSLQADDDITYLIIQLGTKDYFTRIGVSYGAL